MNTNTIYLLLPNILGFIFGRMCPMNAPLYKTKSQPPGWVFGVVWPILFLLIGWNWMLTKDNQMLNILHILMIMALNMWVYTVGCHNNYKSGSFIFISIIALSLAVWMLSSLESIGDKNKWYIPLLLIPYLSWILFAHQLNVHIVEKQ